MSNLDQQIDLSSINSIDVLSINDNEMNHLIEFHPFFSKTDLDIYKLIYFHNPINSLYQVGPTCGLVTILLANQLLQPNSNMKLDQLLEKAIELKLTKQGEMFSAKNIEILATKILNLNAKTLVDLEDNRNLIIKNLINKNAVLIPYDTDRNNEPCIRNGEKAHWCISIGFCFKIEINKFNEILNNDTPSIIDLKQFKLDHLIDQLLKESIDLSLLCKQGKSKLLKLFSFNELVSSNKNLKKVDDKILADSNYLIPENGIDQTLCNKFVIISNQ